MISHRDRAKHLVSQLAALSGEGTLAEVLAAEGSAAIVTMLGCIATELAEIRAALAPQPDGEWCPKRLPGLPHRAIDGAWTCAHCGQFMPGEKP